MAKIEGGCLCGQVRYQSDADPIFQGVCHCKNCQKQAGTAYSVLVGLPLGSLAVTGTLSTYEDTGESGGKVQRRFCGTCGSPIVSELAGSPLTILKAGTLDDTSWLTPAIHVWTDSAMNCSTIPEGVPKFGKNPG